MPNDESWEPKTVITVDDMVATGSCFSGVLQAVVERNGRRIFVDDVDLILSSDRLARAARMQAPYLTEGLGFADNYGDGIGSGTAYGDHNWAFREGAGTGGFGASDHNVGNGYGCGAYGWSHSDGGGFGSGSLGNSDIEHHAWGNYDYRR